MMISNVSQIHFVAYQLFRLYCWMTTWRRLVPDTRPLHIRFLPFHSVPLHISVFGHLDTTADLHKSYVKHTSKTKEEKKENKSSIKVLKIHFIRMNKSQSAGRMLNVLIMWWFCAFAIYCALLFLVLYLSSFVSISHSFCECFFLGLSVVMVFLNSYYHCYCNRILWCIK